MATANPTKQAAKDARERKTACDIAEIKDIWKAMGEIKFEKAEKVLPVTVDIMQKGLKWENEYTMEGHGTQVIFFLKKTNIKY